MFIPKTVVLELESVFAIDIAIVVERDVEQNAWFLLGRDRHAVHRLGHRHTDELANFLGRRLQHV